MEPIFIQVHSEVIRYLEQLHETQEQYHIQYKEYIEKNRVSKVFGLDSFYYQSRLYDLETKQLNEQYLFINNRIYCDYYKLYGMIKVFYKEHFKLEPRKRTYPIYKDLETFKPYDIEESLSLNVDILEMIKKSNACIHKNEEDIRVQCSNPSLNIENYKYNHHYNNTLLRNKVELYEKYLHSYHIYHMSFLSHLRDKIMLMFRQTKNRVLMGNTESWVDERLIQDVPTRNSRYEEPNLSDVINHVIQPVNTSVPLGNPLPPLPEVPAVPQIPVEVLAEVPSVPQVPVEVPAVPEVPVEVPSVPQVPVEVLLPPLPEVPAVPQVPVEVPAVPEVPVEVPAVPQVPVEVLLPLQDVPAVIQVPVEVSSVPQIPVEVPVVPQVPVEVLLPLQDVPSVPHVPVDVPAVPEVPAEVLIEVLAEVSISPSPEEVPTVPVKITLSPLQVFPVEVPVEGMAPTMSVQVQTVSTEESVEVEPLLEPLIDVPKKKGKKGKK